jgi:flagellar basal body-associated protein FliL
MNKKIIQIVALLMLVISGSVVSAWPWSSNEDNQNNNIKFDQSKFEWLLQD